MTERKRLTIRFGDTEADFQEFESIWRAAERGETSPHDVNVLTFESLAGFLACLTRKRWALLQHLKRHGPVSIRALAEGLGRDYKNVHTDVGRLMELDLIERNTEGQIHVVWDEIDARIALAA